MDCTILCRTNSTSDTITIIYYPMRGSMNTWTPSNITIIEEGKPKKDLQKISSLPPALMTTRLPLMEELLRSQGNSRRRPHKERQYDSSSTRDLRCRTPSKKILKTSRNSKIPGRRNSRGYIRRLRGFSNLLLSLSRRVTSRESRGKWMTHPTPITTLALTKKYTVRNT